MGWRVVGKLVGHIAETGHNEVKYDDDVWVVVTDQPTSVTTASLILINDPRQVGGGYGRVHSLYVRPILMFIFLSVLVLVYFMVVQIDIKCSKSRKCQVR